MINESKEIKEQKSAHDEIRTRAGLPPADLESAALDRSATCAWDTIPGMNNTFMLIRLLLIQVLNGFYRSLIQRSIALFLLIALWESIYVIESYFTAQVSSKIGETDTLFKQLFHEIFLS